MADTLLTTEKATIDGDDNFALRTNTFTCESSDPTVAAVDGTSVIGPDGFGFWFLVGQAPGTVTVTATRVADGRTATVDVAVSAPELPAFTIHLGAHSAK